MNPKNRKFYEEIESVISEYPKVAEVKVMSVPDKSGEEVIKAVISIKEFITFKEITDWCYERLGNYKVPKVIECKLRPMVPYEMLLNIKDIKKENGYLCMTMPYRKEITNPYGVIHGGAISSLADDAMATLANINYGPMSCYTKKFEIEFMESAKSDLFVETKIIKKKLNLCICEAEVKDKEGKLCSAPLKVNTKLCSQGKIKLFSPFHGS